MFLRKLAPTTASPAHAAAGQAWNGVRPLFVALVPTGAAAVPSTAPAPAARTHGGGN
jgi:hypothetical protein